MAEVKYFINYEDFLNVNEINKQVDLDCEDLKIVKKYKDGTVKITPILVFKGYSEDFSDYIKSIKNNKKGISLMVELTEKEKELCNPIYIKKYITYDQKHFELLPKEVSLINYEAYANMSIKEINSGNIHKLVKLIPSTSNSKYYEIDQTDILTNNNILEQRTELAQKKLECDLYFLTDNKELIEKYKNNVTLLKEEKDGVFKIVSKTITIIDSIPQTIVNDMTNETFKCLYNFCNKSIPVNIVEEDDICTIDTKRCINYSKKGYMYLGTNLHNILYNQSVIPLLKYINIYSLTEKGYKKTTIEEHMKKNNILKYIKKPSKN